MCVCKHIKNKSKTALWGEMRQKESAKGSFCLPYFDRRYIACEVAVDDDYGEGICQVIYALEECELMRMLTN